VRRARTLLVGASDVFLDGVVEWVAGDAQVEVVGRARSGAQALERVESLRAELVLVDVTLPDTSGFEVVRRIKSRPDAPLVVMSSFHDSRAARLAARAAGADGFVPQSETAEGMLPLVGELLRQREVSAREVPPGIPTMRVRPADVS
jgi:DNA-binding NarL/FixJ family response regulator